MTTTIFDDLLDGLNPKIQKEYTEAKVALKIALDYSPRRPLCGFVINVLKALNQTNQLKGMPFEALLNTAEIPSIRLRSTSDPPSIIAEKVLHELELKLSEISRSRSSVPGELRWQSFLGEKCKGSVWIEYGGNLDLSHIPGRVIIKKGVA
ncbi:Uu.00g023520.m01.CDS01 [Anthostomella pinea]|uniref:Uu.00g023520.m01.CDS01 n=1 Tax=Anthostomella pinea TaxID=933095 RepID=A0AAI8W1A1_9PEZI|nr:Uu.00g023520.m01.CDS01 [Anthostomella pinea]